jgi:hypothetical protein
MLSPVSAKQLDVSISVTKTSLGSNFTRRDQETPGGQWAGRFRACAPLGLGVPGSQPRRTGCLRIVFNRSGGTRRGSER